jgi:hypothetical protein
MLFSGVGLEFSSHAAQAKSFRVGAVVMNRMYGILVLESRFKRDSSENFLNLTFVLRTVPYEHRPYGSSRLE